MNKYHKKVILIDTVNNVAYDLTLLSSNLAQRVGGSDIIESVDMITNEMSFNLFQAMANDKDSREEYLTELAFDLHCMNTIKKEAIPDQKMYTEIAGLLESYEDSACRTL